MNNHFHLLAKVKESTVPQNVSAAFKRFGISFAQSINKQEDRKGSLFMRPIKRKRIISKDYYRHVLVYIHSNPLNHRVVRSINDYHWSSFPIFISTRNDSNLLFSMRDIS